MNTKTRVRQKVKCATCGTTIMRVIWNYGKNRPIVVFFCDNACKGEWQRAQREALGFTRGWLIDQYVTQGKSANDIAREIGRNSKRVWEWIVDYGIPTRARGHNTSHLPKDGSTFKGKRHSMETRSRLSAIAIADGRMPFNKSVGPPYRGKHGADTPNWKGGITPERQAFYSSLEWKECVAQVWKRDDARCRKCGLDHRTIDRKRVRFHIHHIDSFMIKERRADIDNLVLLCDKCHRWVHSSKNKRRVFLGKGH